MLTYSSFIWEASAKAVSSTPLVRGEMVVSPMPAPLTLGSRSSERMTSAASPSGAAPSLRSIDTAMPPRSESMTASRCSGSICGWPCRDAKAWAF